MNTTQTATKVASEPRPRSVGELKQLLGTTDLSVVSTGEVLPSKTADAFDVNPETRHQLRWKPEFYAEVRKETGDVRLTVTRAESAALIGAGAVPRDSLASGATRSGET